MFGLIAIAKPSHFKKLKTKHQNSLGVGKPTGLHMIARIAKAMLSMHEGD